MPDTIESSCNTTGTSCIASLPGGTAFIRDAEIFEMKAEDLSQDPPGTRTDLARFSIIANWDFDPDIGNLDRRDTSSVGFSCTIFLCASVYTCYADKTNTFIEITLVTINDTNLSNAETKSRVEIEIPAMTLLVFPNVTDNLSSVDEAAFGSSTNVQILSNFSWGRPNFTTWNGNLSLLQFLQFDIQLLRSFFASLFNASLSKMPPTRPWPRTF